MLRKLLFVIALAFASTPAFAQIRTIGGGASGVTYPTTATNGTAAAPSYSFANSSGLGLYRFGADTLGIATGGVHSLRISGGASVRLYGGAGNMLIVPGTGASRNLQLYATNAGGSEVLNFTTSATQASWNVPVNFSPGSVTTPGISFCGGLCGFYNFAGGTDTMGVVTSNLTTLRISGGASATLVGGAGNMTVQAGTGNSRNMLLQATNGTGTATTAITAKFDTVRVHDELVLPSLTAASGTPNSVCMDATSKQVVENAATSCVVSSARYKQNIVPLSPIVADRIVSQLRPTTFKYRAGGRTAVGLIAEQVATVDARFVTNDASGRPNAVNYEQVTVVLLKQVQTLTAKLDRMCKAGVREAC